LIINNRNKNKILHCQSCGRENDDIITNERYCSKCWGEVCAYMDSLKKTIDSVNEDDNN